jgi:hypothetical protein
MGWASDGSTSSSSSSSCFSSFIICCNSCREGFYREGFDNIAHLQYCAGDFTEKVCNCVRDFTNEKDFKERDLTILQSGILLIEIQNLGENEGE